MLITYVKGGIPAQIFLGEGVYNDEGYICYFLTEVIKFYSLMLLLYPGELCRLLGASSFPYTVLFSLDVIYKYILLVRVICEKYRLRGEANFLSRHREIRLFSKLVFFAYITITNRIYLFKILPNI